jgi:hypothetical protein
MEPKMGLDMYAFTTAAEITAVDFKQPKSCTELFYWRKHPDLHGWMEALYRLKGGAQKDFNVSPVRLDLADLDALEAAIQGGKLPFTEGFFFGESQPEDKLDDLDFIAKARAALAKGMKVFYTSWW